MLPKEINSSQHSEIKENNQENRQKQASSNTTTESAQTKSSNVNMREKVTMQNLF